MADLLEALGVSNKNTMTNADMDEWYRMREFEEEKDEDETIGAAAAVRWQHAQ